MNFNKVKALTDDVKEVAKALQYSTVLKVSEDGTKVSRITPFVPRSKDEVDLCTIYVVLYHINVSFLLVQASAIFPYIS